MNKLLIIENEESDYKAVKKIFDDCWLILPENHGDINYKDNNQVISTIKNAIRNECISSIILDISLQGDDDQEGFKIIEEIRKVDENKFKIIPIYCYSQHGDDEEFIIKAFKVGATNIFSKGDINEQEPDEIMFLKQSLTALAFIYSSACRYPQDFKNVIAQIKEINEHLENIDDTNKINLNAILRLSSLSNISSIIEINEQNKHIIEDAVGGEEVLNSLLQTKWFTEDKENREKLIDNVAEIFANIPVLSSVAAILKGINLISKNAK